MSAQYDEQPFWALGAGRWALGGYADSPGSGCLWVVDMVVDARKCQEGS